jgi:hypothetical protein
LGSRTEAEDVVSDCCVEAGVPRTDVLHGSENVSRFIIGALSKMPADQRLVSANVNNAQVS